MKCYTSCFHAFFVFLFCFFIQPTYGQTWKQIATPANRNFKFDVIVLPNGVLAVDDILGVWVTPDQGRNWNRTLNSYNVLKMLSSNVLYAVGGSGKSFICVSDSTGNNWVNIANDSIERPFVTQIAARSSEDIFALATMFLGDNPWIYRTTNGGTTWNSASSEEPKYFSHLIAGSGSLLFGLEETSGFYRSLDNGATWSVSNGGFTTSAFTSLSRNDQGHLFVTSSAGKLYRSTDQGVSWESMTTAFADTVTLQSLNISATGEMFVVANATSQYTINKSTDGGISWNQIGQPINWGSVWSMAITPRGTIVVLVDYDLYTNDETFLITSVSSEKNGSFSGYELEQNYPNPFNPTTMIRFALPRPSFVTLKMYNTLGEEIATLAAENFAAGRYAVEWNARGHASGVYLYRLEAGKFIETKKLALLK